MNDYMKIVSNIETQRQINEANNDTSFTLNKLLLSIYDEFRKLKTTYLIVDSCRSIIYNKIALDAAC